MINEHFSVCFWSEKPVFEQHSFTMVYKSCFTNIKLRSGATLASKNKNKIVHEGQTKLLTEINLKQVRYASFGIVRVGWGSG